MSAACVCPDVQLDPTHPIPADPLRCACCGSPIVLTCAGECGTEHVRAAFGAASTAMHATRGDFTPTGRRRETRPRRYQPKACACGVTFMPTGPRDSRCPTCKGNP